MNEPDLQNLERRLRTLPPLLDVPPSLVTPSVQAAVADPESPAPIRRAPRRSPRWQRRWSLAGVVGIAAAAAVAGTIAITSQSGGHGGFQRIATLTGAGNASGYVAVGRADGAIEPVVVSVDHLNPARDGQYYEIWFQTGGKQVPGVAFNASPNGDGGSPSCRPDQHEVGAMLDHPPVRQRPQHLHHRHARHPHPNIDVAGLRLAGHSNGAAWVPHATEPRQER